MSPKGLLASSRGQEGPGHQNKELPSDLKSVRTVVQVEGCPPWHEGSGKKKRDSMGMSLSAVSFSSSSSLSSPAGPLEKLDPACRALVGGGGGLLIAARSRHTLHTWKTRLTRVNRGGGHPSGTRHAGQRLEALPGQALQRPGKLQSPAALCRGVPADSST